MRLVQVLHHQVVTDDGPVWAVAGVHKDARRLVGGDHDAAALSHPVDVGARVDDGSATLKGKLVALKHQLAVGRFDLKHREL